MACTDVPGPISTLRPDPPSLPWCPVSPNSYDVPETTVLAHTVRFPSITKKAAFPCLGALGTSFLRKPGSAPRLVPCLIGKSRPSTHALKLAQAQSWLSRSASLPRRPRWPREGLTWASRGPAVMASWVFCNRCFQPPHRKSSFSLTSCGHVYCDSCLRKGLRGQRKWAKEGR